jgi:spore germination protein GerM
MGKRRKKKGSIGNFIVFLFLIGIVASIFLLFRNEIVNTFHPLFEKIGLVEERKEIVLYFSDQDGEYLIGEKRKIIKKEVLKEEGIEVIDELIKGPKGKLIPTLPSRTKCLHLEIDEKGVATVNFNRALSREHPGGSSAEILTAYSIVNSLTQNFRQIKQVQILIVGSPVETIAGHLSLRQPIAPNPNLIKRQ